ncbi:DHA2 family efflux MFS transporter permease subunit [Hydrocarboniphaga sp.]|uniref:DHA2 family efflux MFS transporter permease subunit n=1 Tax=Hydrocarboniphaga sp. TaxID=2033016 RepID=UPI003452F6A2
MITATVMLASILQTLDNTIANVALPHMQGSLSATQEQMSWVLTSYIVAAAIMTPVTGWLASQFGRRQLFLGSILGFTLASVLCGIAQSLPEMVLFRFIQGVAGAALVPMSQAVLFDINPPERHGKAMAAWGQGVLLGPMLGPILGGWLTDNYSWRWVFYINVPLGIMAFVGVLLFLPKDETRPSQFDLFGFTLLSLGIGALQIMLDRGSTLDWFGSREIWIESIVAGLAFYLFAVHSATSKNPFIPPALFKDRNFLTGNVFIFVIGVVLFATLALLPTMLQVLMGYPVYYAGLLTAPRSLGTLAAMLIVGQLVGRFDSRLIIASGFGLTAISLWQMTQFDMQMDASPVFWSGILQGLGTGIIFVPMAAMTFATLPGNLRNEASAMFSLARNIGSSIGISVVQALLISNTQVMHASLSELVSPFNLANRNPQLAAQLTTHEGSAGLNAAITGQASMVAYIDDFKLMLILTLLALPLLLLVRAPQKANAEDAPHVAAE